MINVAICDDERIFINELEGMLRQYMLNKGMVFNVESFQSGKEFVELGYEMTKYKIVFLDINMGDLDGIEIAKSIRENSKDIFIVFVTAFVNYSIEGYKVDAIRYILKDDVNLAAAVFECMDAIQEKMHHKVKWMQFSFCEGCKRVSLERILYIESKLHKLEFYILENGLMKYTTQGTLNSIDAQLSGEGFLRVHQSFLVNLNFIKSIRRYEVMLNNGMWLSVPRARYKYVEERVIAYKGEV